MRRRTMSVGHGRITPSRMHRLAAAGVLASVWILAGPSAAGAVPDGDDCQALAAEYADLLTQGIEDTLAKGPGWAKTHLPPSEIERIAHFLSVEDKVRFQCAGLAEEGTAEPAAAPVPLPKRKPGPPLPSRKSAAS